MQQLGINVSRVGTRTLDRSVKLLEYTEQGCSTHEIYHWSAPSRGEVHHNRGMQSLEYTEQGCSTPQQRDVQGLGIHTWLSSPDSELAAFTHLSLSLG